MTVPSLNPIRVTRLTASDVPVDTETNAVTLGLYSEVVSSALAENTRIAYEKGWTCFREFCATRNLLPLSVTPEDIADFMIELATRPRRQSRNTAMSGKVLSMGTVVLYRSAINRKYVESGVVSPTNHPTVNAVLKGLARLRGTPARQVKALREYHIRKMLSICDQMIRQPSKRLIGLRDSAIIAIGFAGALRRSEICGLTMEDIELVESDPRLYKKNHSNGVQHSPSDLATKMYVYIRRSKTDQEGKGHKVAILGGKYLKPIQRLQDWLEASGITNGPVFQTMKRGGTLRGRPLHHSDVPRLVKYYASLAGLDSKDISGHSLRAGFVTSAACHNARLDKIMEITRHTNPSTVMKYIRDADSFTDHAGENFL